MDKEMPTDTDITPILVTGATGKQGGSGRAVVETLERGLQINDSTAAYQTAINGSGIALGRTTLVAFDLATGRLVRPFGDAADCEFAYYFYPELTAIPEMRSSRIGSAPKRKQA
jgi:DNA-binding transcriptional LysR family regulator